MESTVADYELAGVTRTRSLLTDEVLREVARCNDEEIAALRDGGVVA